MVQRRREADGRRDREGDGRTGADADPAARRGGAEVDGMGRATHGRLLGLSLTLELGVGSRLCRRGCTTILTTVDRCRCRRSMCRCRMELR